MYNISTVSGVSSAIPTEHSLDSPSHQAEALRIQAASGRSWSRRPQRARIGDLTPVSHVRSWRSMPLSCLKTTKVQLQ